MRKTIVLLYLLLFAALALSIFSTAAFAQVAINTNLVTGQMTGSVADIYRTAFLHFQLVNCGDNVPVMQGQATAMVQDSFNLYPSTPGSAIVGSIIGNDQLTCGNVISTYYIVTPMKDASHPLRGGVPYVICSSAASITTCGNAASLGTFDITVADPMTQPAPTPGFTQIYGNPTNGQTIVQPNGTVMDFIGTFQFENGLFVGGVPAASLSSLNPLLVNFIYVTDGTLGSNPCLGGSTGAFAFYINGVWSCAGQGGGGGGGGSGTVNPGIANAVAAYQSTAPTVGPNTNILFNGLQTLFPNGPEAVGSSIDPLCVSVPDAICTPEGSTAFSPMLGHNGIRATSTGWVCTWNDIGEYSCLSPFLVNAGNFTNTQQNNYFYSALGGINTSTWYSSAQQGNFSTDANTGGIACPFGATVHQCNAVSGYAVSAANSVGGGGGLANFANTVGGYFTSQSVASNTANWGINALVQDTVSTSNTWMVGQENDTNFYGSPAYAVNFQGNGTGQGTMPSAIAAGATTFLGAAFMDVSTPYTGLGGSYWRWPLGINFRPGAVNGPAIQIQMPCLSGTCNSDPITFSAFSSSSVVTSQLYGDSSGNLDFQPGDAGGVYEFMASGGGLQIPGSSSGASTLKAPSTGGGTLNLPAGSGNIIVNVGGNTGGLGAMSGGSLATSGNVSVGGTLGVTSTSIFTALGTFNGGISASSLVFNSAAPTSCTVTGAGSSGSCGFTSGSTDFGGIMLITTSSSGNADTGTLAILFSSAVGSHNAVCRFWPNNTGAGSWVQTTSTTASFVDTTETTAGDTQTWYNASTTLSNSTGYRVSYACQGT